MPSFFTLLFRSVLFALITTVYRKAASSEHPLQKRSFCHLYSECRMRAQQELYDCAGGTVPALMAKRGEIGLSTLAESQSRQKCTAEVSTTIGRSMRILYSRMERKSLKCAEELIKKELDGEQLLLCKAANLELISGDYNYSSPFSLLKNKITKQKAEEPQKWEEQCSEAHNGHLERCRLLGPCCAELERCLATIELESNIRVKEVRVLRLMEKCVNETPLRSAEVIFTANLTAKGELNIDPVPIIASSSAPTPPNLPVLNFSMSEPVLCAHRTPPIKMIPQPDPTFRNIVDLIFPRLKINGGRQQHKKMSKLENVEKLNSKMHEKRETTSPSVKAERIGAFVMESNNLSDRHQPAAWGEAQDRAHNIDPLENIFCERNKECREVIVKMAKMIGKCVKTETIKSNSKCDEIKPMNALWKLLGSKEVKEHQQKRCANLNVFVENCEKLRECCASKKGIQ